jgi:hypothetical protein
VRFPANRRAALQNFQYLLDGSFRDIQLLGEPADFHRPARVVDDVMLDDDPPLRGRGLEELDDLFAIFPSASKGTYPAFGFLIPEHFS